MRDRAIQDSARPGLYGPRLSGEIMWL
jgi:hypothetical protein